MSAKCVNVKFKGQPFKIMESKVLLNFIHVSGVNSLNSHATFVCRISMSFSFRKLKLTLNMLKLHCDVNTEIHSHSFLYNVTSCTIFEYVQFENCNRGEDCQ